MFQREFDQMVTMTTRDVVPHDIHRLAIMRGFLYVARCESVLRSLKDFEAAPDPMCRQILLSIYDVLSTTGNADALHSIMQGDPGYIEERLYRSIVMDAIVFCTYNIYKDMTMNAQRGVVHFPVTGTPVDATTH